jgi:RNA polymerase sigma factor (sigma-70 family)
MITIEFSDSALIEAIETGGDLREQALMQVYKEITLRQFILKLVTRFGGNDKDAEDIFQETVTLFDCQVRHGKFQGKCSWKTYFMGIAKWQWACNCRKRKPSIEFDAQYHGGTIPSIDVESMNAEKQTMMFQVLTQLGEPCRTILLLYSLSYSMAEIAHKIGCDNPNFVKKKVHDCRNKFKQFVEAHPQYYDYLEIRHPCKST